jgi:NADH:ubiquinone oxidoreductase subunit K
VLRLSLIIASLANAAAGVGLGVLWYRYRHDDGMPIIVLFVALSLFFQAAFTLGYIEGLWTRLRIPALKLFITGEAAAALIGGLAILQGVLYN